MRLASVSPSLFSFLSFLVVAFAGCKKESSGAPSCGDRVDAFEEALASPSAGTCEADSDCRCYPGGISKMHGCGGITDAKTGEKLASIAAEHMKAGCKSGIDCAAWMCMPSCQRGKCTDAPPKGAPTPAPSPSASASASTSTSPSPSPSPSSSEAGISCDARLVEIDKVLASATRKCATNKDCVCFRGGVSKKEPCGGITDAKTNARFESIAKEWSAAGCKKEEVMCPAMVCESQCVDGTCAPPQIIQ